MTPYGIVYKDTVPAINEGADIWQKRSGMIKKSHFIMTFILSALSIIAVNSIIFYFRREKDLYFTATVLITVMEIISVGFMLKSSLRKNLKNVFNTTVKNKNLKQAVIREYDIEFSSPYSKANYFYDEIKKVVEGVNSISIVIEEKNLPICISKTGVLKGDAEKFISLLKEKMQGRYYYENVIGGKN